jgi:hypothetical protein
MMIDEWMIADLLTATIQSPLINRHSSINRQ